MTKLCTYVFAALLTFLISVQQPVFAGKSDKNAKKTVTTVNNSPVTQLESAYPWEYIQDNVKTFRFIVMNFYTDLFDPATVAEISTNLENYIAEHVYPSWRHKVSIEFFVPKSQDELAAEGIQFQSSTYLNALPLPGTFIPIILTNNFSDNIPDNFATAVHGNVSGSPTTGYNASLYIDGDFYLLTGPFPFGTPFIVIPAGTAESGNGINGQVAANLETNEGPTDFYQVLSLVMSQQVIATLIDPSATKYVASGNPLGNPDGGPLPTGTSNTLTDESFYLWDATAPFMYGYDNIIMCNNWTFTNFALPAYFMPYDNSGRYDLLGRTYAPLTPFKGNQFVIYQNFFATDYPTGELSDLLVGTYVSNLTHPYDIELISGGSIYDYSGWDMQIRTQATELEMMFDVKVPTRKRNSSTAVSAAQNKFIPKVTNSAVANGRSRNSKQFQQGLSTAKYAGKTKKCRPIKKTVPELLPFEYVDDNGFVTVRFAIINYVPQVLDPAEIDKIIPVLEKEMNDRYLPYWNKRVEMKNYTVLPGDIGLPTFDGSFIPFLFLNVDQFDLDQVGGIIVSGGGYNGNNVPNAIAGPMVSQFLKATPDFAVPQLPLANPFLIASELNFPGEVTVTTNVANLGPFTASPTGSSATIPTTFPIVALGANANPLNACSPLVNNLTGKIGVNKRHGCDSLVYPNNMANAGAIAFLTVYSSQTLFGATGAEIWGATMGPEGQALIDALNSNSNITISISAPHSAAGDYNTFSSLCAHEMEELSSDPNYATWFVTFNPYVDSAVLFSQLEASDPDERFYVVGMDDTNAYNVEGFPLPSYFIAFLKTYGYDNIGAISRALVPEARQQCLSHYKNEPNTPFNPLQITWISGPVEGGFPEYLVSIQGSIFDPYTWYAPQTPIVTDVLSDTPLESIYDALINLRDVIFI